MTRLDRISALVAMAFAVAVAVEAYRLDAGTLRSPGPGFTPLLYAAILFTLSGVLWTRSRPGAVLAFAAPWRSILLVLALLLAWGLTIELVGYVVCTFAVVTLLARVAGAPWLRALVFGAAATGVVHLVFVSWLAVPLPRGPFG